VRLNDLAQVPVGITAMNDDGSAELARQLQLPDQYLLLDLAWGMIVVLIQTDLSDGYHLRIQQQIAQPLEVAFRGLGGIVRMNPRRGVDPGITGGNRRGGAQVPDAGPTSHGQDVCHAGSPCAFDCLLAVSLEGGVVEMGVRINKELSD
jgi:hypothetical protein